MHFSKDQQDESFLKRYSKHLFGEEEEKEQRQIEHYCHLPSVDIRDLADTKGKQPFPLPLSSYSLPDC